MLNNVVKTVLIAKDEASRVIEGLQRNVAASSKGFNLLGAASGVALGGIIAGSAAAIAGGIGMTKAFSEANSVSMSALKAANNLTAEFSNISLTVAEDYIASLNKKLVDAAAVLPGATKEYLALSNVIANDVARAFQNADGTLNVKDWEKATTDIVSLLKFVGGEADQAKVLLGSEKLLAGNATLNEIRQYDFFGGNVAFMKGLEKAQNDLGKEWKQFTQEERVKTLTGLKNVLLSDEMIDKLSQSVSGIVEVFNTRFFDPTTGLFGIMRELDSSGGSVYKSLVETVKLFIGQNGIITTMLNNLGLDPMVSLKNGIDKFNNFVSRFTNYLQIFNNTEDKLDFSRLNLDLSDKLSTFLNLDNLSIPDIGKMIADLINNAVAMMRSLDWGAIGTTTGTLFGQILQEGLDQLSTLIKSIDYGSVLLLLGEIGIGVVKGLANFLINLDPNTYITGARVLIGSAIALMLVPLATGAIGGLTSAILGGLAVLAASIGITLTAPIILAIAAVGALLVGVFLLIKNNWETIKANILSGLESLKEVASLGWDLIKQGFQGYINTFISTINFLTSLLDKIPGIDIPKIPKLGNAAEGFIPDAFSRELKAMPAGANPIIANTSELILTRNQQQALLNNRGSNISLGGITINTQPNQNPSEIAEMVIQQIERRLSQQYAV